MFSEHNSRISINGVLSQVLLQLKPGEVSIDNTYYYYIAIALVATVISYAEVTDSYTDCDMFVLYIG